MFMYIDLILNRFCSVNLVSPLTLRFRRDRRQVPEDRGQKSEVRRQRSEDRGQVSGKVGVIADPYETSFI